MWFDVVAVAGRRCDDVFFLGVKLLSHSWMDGCLGSVTVYNDDDEGKDLVME